MIGPLPTPLDVVSLWARWLDRWLSGAFRALGRPARPAHFASPPGSPSSPPPAGVPFPEEDPMAYGSTVTAPTCVAGTPSSVLLEIEGVKLVAYTIVSIAREHERVLSSGYQVVTDRMDGETFTSWMIALYLQSADLAVRHDERKYLRVRYSVDEIWPKQDLRFEERQLRALDLIAAGVLRPRPGPTPTPRPVYPAAPAPAKPAPAKPTPTPEERILAALERSPKLLDVPAIAEATGLDEEVVRQRLQSLKDAGKVRQVAIRYGVAKEG